MFGVEGLYYLDLNLKYKCDTENGSAKFDKTKKTLTIKLPVVGLTEGAQKVADQHYQEYLEMETKRQEEYKRLEMSTLEEDAAKRKIDAYKPGRGEQEENNDVEQDENQENRDQNGINADDGADGVINEGVSGVSKKNFVMSVDDDKAAAEAGVNDKYSKPIPSMDDRAAGDEDKRDSTTI